MWGRITTLMLTCVASISCTIAYAEDIPSKYVLQKVLELSKGCKVTRTDNLPLLVSPKISSRWRNLHVIGVQTEGCDGGNNYQYNTYIFDTAVEKPLRVSVDGLTFPWIEKIFNSEKRGVPNVTIIAPAYADEDAHCCPSLLTEVRIWAEADTVNWKRVRQWKK